MSFNNQHAAKKTYQSPKLVVYGDIRQLTTNSNVTTAFGDNPTVPPSSTQKSTM